MHKFPLCTLGPLPGHLSSLSTTGGLSSPEPSTAGWAPHQPKDRQDSHPKHVYYHIRAISPGSGICTLHGAQGQSCLPYTTEHHRLLAAPTATCVTHSTCGRHCHRLWSLASTDGEPPACPTPAGVGTLLQLLTAEHRGAEGAHLISGATCDGSMNRAQPPAGSIPSPRDGPATHCGAEPGNSTVRSGSAEPSVSERLASGTGQRAGPISCPPSSGEAGPSARTRARQGGAGRAAPAPGSEQRARCRCL